MASTTARELRPAYGDLQAAVLVMATRYAQAHGQYIHGGTRPGTVDHERLRRTDDRRFKALARLTAALAHR